MIGHTRLHGWYNAESLMDSSEIVKHEGGTTADIATCDLRFVSLLLVSLCIHQCAQVKSEDSPLDLVRAACPSETLCPLLD